MSLISAQFYHMPGRYERVHHSSPNSFGANGHLHKKVCKTGKVIERSRDVTPRPTQEKSKGRPRSPCAPNMVQFRPLFPELRDFEKNGTFSSVIVVTAQVGTFVPGERSKVKWSYK